MAKVVTVGAAKVLRTSVTFTGNIEGVSSQIVVANPAANVAIAQFTQKDFQTALGKVSRKKGEAFFGENVRDAIKTIKG